MALAADLVLFNEIEPVTHGEQVTYANLVSGIGRVAPFGDGSQFFRVQSTFVHQGAHDHVQERFGH
jgi:hypothetical protein